MYQIVFYMNKRGDEPVKDFLRKLNKKSRAKVNQYINLLEQHGPNLLRPYADNIADKIKELRIRCSDGKIRVLYFFFSDKRIVLAHAIKKKTSEIPEKDVEQAKRNMKDFIERYNQKEIKF